MENLFPCTLSIKSCLSDLSGTAVLELSKGLFPIKLSISSISSISLKLKFDFLSVLNISLIRGIEKLGALLERNTGCIVTL